MVRLDRVLQKYAQAKEAGKEIWRFPKN